MFQSIYHKNKKRLYLGKLAVASRKDLKRHIDQWGLVQFEDLETGLYESLYHLFSLPLAENEIAFNKYDLILDVYVSKFQSGDAWSLTLGGYSLPIFWRPKIYIKSHLYFGKSGKTKATFSITEKMKWHIFIGRLLTFKAMFRFKPVFDKQDMEKLLYQGCLRLLLKTQRKI